MRKNLAVWAVAGSMLLAWAGEASAQRGGRGNGGGGRGYGGGYSTRGNSGYRGGNEGYRGGYSGYRGGYSGYRGYGGGYSNFGIGLGLGYAGAVYYGTGGYGGGYYSPSYGPYTEPGYSYYYPQQAAYYPQPAAASVPTETVRTSLYSPNAAASQGASITVMVPAPDSSIWFDATPMASQGTRSLFQSPPLEAGRTFAYTVRARWKAADGKDVEQSRRIEVRAGQSSTADFR